MPEANHQFRSVTREDVHHFSIDVAIDIDGQRVDAALRDLSPEGMAIAVKLNPPPAIGTPVTVTFTALDDREPLVFEAEVRWARLKRRLFGTRLRVGLQFCDPDDFVRYSLEHWISAVRNAKEELADTLYDDFDEATETTRF